MKHIDRLISLSVLGVLTISFAPLTSAQETDTTVDREAIRTAMQACRDSNEERSDIRDCMKTVREENGLTGRGRRGRGRGNGEFRSNLSDEVKDALKACLDNNEDRDDKKTCAEGILEANGIEKPEGNQGRQGRGRGKGEFRSNLSDEVKDQLKACHENNDEHDDKKECAKEIFEANGIEMPEHAPESRGRRGRGRRGRR